MRICFCVYARYAGFVREVPKDPERDFIPSVLSILLWLYSKLLCIYSEEVITVNVFTE